MHENVSDTELLQLLRQDDEAAFTSIYNRYWDKLYAISFNHCKQKHLSEEIVQDIFMSLWDRRDTLTITHLSSYLATAAKFSVFKYLLREKKRDKLLVENSPSEYAISEDEYINTKFLKDYINGVVETLPPQCKLVFRYSRESELSIPEIAEKMQISPKTVESHLSKALKVLRIYLRGVRIWEAFIILGTIACFIASHI